MTETPCLMVKKGCEILREWSMLDSKDELDTPFQQQGQAKFAGEGGRGAFNVPNSQNSYLCKGGMLFQDKS